MARSTATSKTKKVLEAKRNQAPRTERQAVPEKTAPRLPVQTILLLPKLTAPRKKTTQPAPTPLSAEGKWILLEL